MSEHADPQTQLAEYESQLVDVNEMLSSDPNEESLLKLRDDLTELIALTKTEVVGSNIGDGLDSESVGNSEIPAADKAPIPTEAGSPADGEKSKVSEPSAKSADAHDEATEMNEAQSVSSATKKKKRKNKNSSIHETFEVPDHLKPLPSDTDAERKRKTRTAKALKSKWRERKKEAEGIEKQRSWKDFMGKKKKKAGGKRERSIFATEEGVNAKVGVISGTSGVRGNMTEFDGKKRHKH
mmetsp:Transcript_47288/g.143209  ORF Transcript_47288/g.143209 Transcript_47288/m.143209 type:complete len:239 (-) Transcript_47288:526-1242(-)